VQSRIGTPSVNLSQNAAVYTSDPGNFVHLTVQALENDGITPFDATAHGISIPTSGDPDLAGITCIVKLQADSIHGPVPYAPAVLVDVGGGQNAIAHDLRTVVTGAPTSFFDFTSSNLFPSVAGDGHYAEYLAWNRGDTSYTYDVGFDVLYNQVLATGGSYEVNHNATFRDYTNALMDVTATFQWKPRYYSGNWQSLATNTSNVNNGLMNPLTATSKHYTEYHGASVRALTNPSVVPLPLSITVDQYDDHAADARVAIDGTAFATSPYTLSPWPGYFFNMNFGGGHYSWRVPVYLSTLQNFAGRVFDVSGHALTGVIVTALRADGSVVATYPTVLDAGGSAGRGVNAHVWRLNVSRRSAIRV